MKRAFTKTTHVYGSIVVKMVRLRKQDGTSIVSLHCRNQECGRRCGMCFETPSVLWSVSDEGLAGLLFSHCVGLEKLAQETALLDGLNAVELCANDERKC